MKLTWPLSAICLAWLVVGTSLAGCAARLTPEAATARPAAMEQSLQEKAAAEATAIIAQAEATALVLQAQAKATALIVQAAGSSVDATPQPEGTENSADVASTPDLVGIIQTQPVENIAEYQDEEAYTVELISAGFAAEGGFIIINFRASKKAVDDFWPGRLSLTDEATGAIYNEVATMPIIGPLIGRPREPGQLGYVMFVNTPPGLPPGSLVTVQLGQFRQENVKVGE